MRNYYKTECLNRAKILIDEGSYDSFIYAALDLRQCIESIIYEKLDGYKKYVPGVVFQKWQPSHALKTLLYFEPDAEQSIKLAIAPESSPGVTSGPFQYIGEHKALTVEWLNKNYNKLGSFLHVQRDKSKKLSHDKLRSELKIIKDKLDEVIKCNLISCSMSERVTFECQACNKKSLANVKAIRKSKRAYCIHPNCGASHSVIANKDGFSFRLEQTCFKCLKCETDNFIPNTDIYAKMEFNCYKCSERHIVLGYSPNYNTLKKYNESN